MRYLIAFIVALLSVPSFAAEDCKIVNGFNLCEDAKIIAKNETVQIGRRISGAEYVLRRVFPEKMSVVYEYNSIYASEDVLKLVGNKSMSDLTKQSLALSCRQFRRDPFVRDGGVLVLKYFYKDGGHIHTNIISNENCNY